MKNAVLLSLVLSCAASLSRAAAWGGQRQEELEIKLIDELTARLPSANPTEVARFMPWLEVPDLPADATKEETLAALRQKAQGLLAPIKETFLESETLGCDQDVFVKQANPPDWLRCREAHARFLLLLEENDEVNGLIRYLDGATNGEASFLVWLRVATLRARKDLLLAQRALRLRER